MIPIALEGLKSVRSLQDLFSAKFASKSRGKQKSAIIAISYFASAA